MHCLKISEANCPMMNQHIPEKTESSATGLQQLPDFLILNNDFMWP
jgi:hypothetical protein